LSDLNFSLTLPGEKDPLPQTIAARTRRVYDALATVYPLSTYFFHSKSHTYVLEHAGIQNGDRVLEIASGSGEMLRRLAGINPHGMTVGLDLSPNMASVAQKRAREENPDASAYCGAVDVRSLPFPDASFDAVVCCYLIELLGRDDIYRTLHEVRRVLRPGGRFSLVVIGQNRPMFRQAYRLGASVARAFWGRLVESEAPEMLRDCGLIVVKDRYIQQGFYPSRVLVSEPIAEVALSRASGQNYGD
jgi:ubiquinone/menaquinone biosynthesis C-methylase UbiE